MSKSLLPTPQIVTHFPLYEFQIRSIVCFCSVDAVERKSFHSLAEDLEMLKVNEHVINSYLTKFQSVGQYC